MKHLFASDVNHYKALFEQQKIELQKQKELNINMHDILIGAEGEHDRILTQEEMNTESTNSNDESLSELTRINTFL